MRLSTSARVRQNTRAAVGASMSRMRPSAVALWGRRTRYAIWRTSGEPPSAGASRAISMRAGSWRWERAMASIRRGMVAESRTV